jgi:hypothetical protein
MLLFDKHTAADQHLHQPRDDLVQQRLQFLVGCRGYFDRLRPSAAAACSEMRWGGQVL